MLQKQDIEKILKINGVSSTAPDEEIRSVLLSARYADDEIDTAIMVLRESTVTHQTRVDGLHKIFRSDEALSPSEISSLLGIDVAVREVSINKGEREFSSLQILLVLTIALLMAGFGVIGAMYVYELGIFHSSVSLVDR